jgi:hypothetical protein
MAGQERFLDLLVPLLDKRVFGGGIELDARGDVVGAYFRGVRARSALDGANDEVI